ncbi:aspartyl-phosphate phosphatase Spo0E family protein [Bacillus chungangensis]|uniref:Prefoldin subunit 5 n=1 Tax=Bacillus chungangensis TaxID=587633 RepID=A0ABT9WPA5_9BACI|nr:aspartyl-phosphate phosphatase Spo0E family protein [Bacillus chungangensis]MDQ0174600.1 prefoldin subunit 5 [Bacillus chungangensis]
MSNNKLEDLSRKIEKLRKQLNELGKVKSLYDPEVVDTSQKLDELLNEYERLKNTIS